eukprot:CAMPEP_0172451302 /NCGR_PEP_ID=MMETSP1065-20121228/9400_1 /TAXON_ID=265537 /ORGANISM="Amphiprora paludosa, Strain CCMP125" /LENGTH=404 /DNA_ID=CAMNT_0013203251 /DNA_START=11 /DNA_END=1225 /DNA_ORIENTATION=-
MATSATDDGELVNNKHLENLVQETLPLSEIVYCFAYGSGVFSQALTVPQNSSNSENPTNNNLIDLIVVVRDSRKFHHENYTKNPSHYWTPPRWMFPAGTAKDYKDHDALVSWFTSWQQPQQQQIRSTLTGLIPLNIRGGDPGVYFNVTDSIKYGVVQVEDFMQDLSDWKYMYLAGRAHKPILPLLDLNKERHVNQRQQIINAQEQINLPAALSAALLFLSRAPGKDGKSVQSCSDLQLFSMIAELSYRGDYRMQMAAEDPKKVQRLVQSAGQLKRFQSLYQPAVEHLLSNGFSMDIGNNNRGDQNKRLWTWDSSLQSQSILESNLPPSLSKSSYNINQSNNAGSVPPFADWLSLQIANRVRTSAKAQSIKGIVTAGPSTALRYAARKLSKGGSVWSKLLFRGHT